MSRIQPPSNPGLFARLVTWAATKRLGKVPEPVQVQGAHSAVLFGGAMMELAQERARLVPLKMKSLASLRAATRVGCPW